MHLKMLSAKMVAILSRWRWVMQHQHLKIAVALRTIRIMINCAGLQIGTTSNYF